jgi:hypothetical protein
VHVAEKSDIGTVPEKEPNKVMESHIAAEALEGRPMTKGKFWKVVCDLYAEMGGNIERT